MGNCLVHSLEREGEWKYLNQVHALPERVALELDCKIPTLTPSPCSSSSQRLALKRNEHGNSDSTATHSPGRRVQQFPGERAFHIYTLGNLQAQLFLLLLQVHAFPTMLWPNELPAIAWTTFSLAQYLVRSCPSAWNALPWLYPWMPPPSPADAATGTTLPPQVGSIPLPSFYCHLPYRAPVK